MIKKRIIYFNNSVPFRREGKKREKNGEENKQNFLN